MDCVNVTTKSAQHAHVRMIAIIVEKWLEFGLFSTILYIYIVLSLRRDVFCYGEGTHLTSFMSAS